MGAFYDPCMRPRYRDMPDPIESAGDSDKSLPPAIRFVDFRGDYDTYFEINVIGPYETVEARDTDLRRLESLPDPRGTAQFYPDRLGSIEADTVVAPAQVAVLKRADMFGFFAAWEDDDDWLDDDEGDEGDDFTARPHAVLSFDNPPSAAQQLIDLGDVLNAFGRLS